MLVTANGLVIFDLGQTTINRKLEVINAVKDNPINANVLLQVL